MRTVPLLLCISLSSLFAADNIWTQETKGMNTNRSQQVIDAYLVDKNITNITFEDDPKVKKRKLSIIENILMLGVSLGVNSAEDTLSNTTGSKSSSYANYEFKFTIGKDFTFWHEPYTQPTRLYLNINYSSLGEEVSSLGWTIGLRENMTYWPLYTTPTYTIYPTFSFELGNATMTRNSFSVNGFILQTDIGLTYQQNHNLEYFLNFKANKSDWNYAQAGKAFEGVVYETLSFGLLVGLNYKFNYEDF